MSLSDWWESWTAVQVIGWVLLHFTWQGAIIGALVASAVWAMRERGADSRYLVCVAGLLAMIAAPLITLVFVLRTQVGADPSALPLPAPLMNAADSSWARLGAALPAITGTWLFGMLAFQARLLLNFSRAQHLRRAGTVAAPAVWRRTAQELSELMGVRAAVRVLESTLAEVPTLIGWLRPVILLPTTALTGLTPDQLRAIIAHELAHVRRHDYAVNVVQSILETVLFYHPAVWWLSGRLRVEREYCCDDVAVSVCGDALCYAQALSSLDALRTVDAQPALASTGGSLMDRICRLVHARNAAPRRNGALFAPLIAVLTLSVTLSAMVVSAKIDEDAAGPVDAAVESVDVVGILEHMDSEHAEMIGALNRAGLDNDVLVTVLRQLGAEDGVLQAIDHATERARFVEGSLDELRGRLARQLAMGETTLDEARKQLSVARLRSRHEWVAERHPPLPGLTIELALAEGAEDGFHHLVITEAMAALPPAMIHAENAEAEGMLLLVAPRVVGELEAHEHLVKLEAEIAEQYEAGLITEAQADARVEAVRLQAHEAMIATIDLAGIEIDAAAAAEMHERIKAAHATEGELEGVWVAETGKIHEIAEGDAFFFSEYEEMAQVHLDRIREHEAAAPLIEAENNAFVEFHGPDGHFVHKAPELDPNVDSFFTIGTSVPFGPHAFEHQHRAEDDKALLDAVRAHLHAEVQAGRLEADAAHERLELLQRSAKEADSAKLPPAHADTVRGKLDRARADLEKVTAVENVERAALLERIERLRAIEAELAEVKAKLEAVDEASE